MRLSSKILVLKEAALDLDTGRDFYDRKEPGLGDYFWDSLISDLESLMIFSGVHEKHHGFHRMPAKRFPYAVYYTVEDDTTYIVAVLPMLRNPVWLEQMLEKRDV